MAQVRLKAPNPDEAARRERAVPLRTAAAIADRTLALRCKYGELVAICSKYGAVSFRLIS